VIKVVLLDCRLATVLGSNIELKSVSPLVGVSLHSHLLLVRDSNRISIQIGFLGESNTSSNL